MNNPYKKILQLLLLFSIPELAARYMSVSVIIPCVSRHAHHLYPLLVTLSQQTVLPDEVIIALSQAHQVHPLLLKLSTEKRWPFKLVVTATTHKRLAGANRNRAVRHASGEIIICQDADDLPHRQRIQIIRHFFETHDIQYLVHCWGHSAGAGRFPEEPDGFIPYNIDEIPSEKLSFDQPQQKPFTNGNPAILRSALNGRSLPEDMAIAEDSTLIAQLFSAFPGKGILVDAYLLEYRSFLSSHTPNQR